MTSERLITYVTNQNQDIRKIVESIDSIRCRTQDMIKLVLENEHCPQDVKKEFQQILVNDANTIFENMRKILLVSNELNDCMETFNGHAMLFASLRHSIPEGNTEFQTVTLDEDV